MGDLLREGDDNIEDADDVNMFKLSVIGKGQGEGEDKEFPDVPKNWGFMTLRRTKKK